MFKVNPYCSLFSDILGGILQSIYGLTSLHVDKVPANIALPHQLTSHRLEKVTDDTTSPVTLKLLKSVGVKQCDGDEREPLYSGVDILIDGRLAVLDGKNWKVFVMDELLQKLGMYKFSGYRYDVSVVSKEEVAVTSGRYEVIEFLHISKTNHITLTRTLTTTAWYYSICLMNDTTFLVSTFEDKRPLKMITLTGEETDFDNLPEKQYAVGYSKSTYIHDRDIMVRTDVLDNTVYMYDNKKGRCELRCAVKDELIKEPTGVCQGPNNSVLVCSEDTNSLVQVSVSGRVIGSHKLDMCYPRTVCMSKDGKKLAVSNGAEANLKLQLFSC